MRLLHRQGLSFVRWVVVAAGFGATWVACAPLVVGGGGGSGAGGGGGGTETTGSRSSSTGASTTSTGGGATTTTSTGSGGSTSPGDGGVVGPLRLLAAIDDTCVLSAGGHVACWGESVSGQLGLGDFSDRSSPTWIPSFDHVADLALGLGALCAEKTDGSVWCWGSNFYGELDATTPYCGSLGCQCTAVPVLSSATPGGALVPGVHGFCEVAKAGTVACWGSTPPVTALGYDVQQAALGYTHACVLFQPQPGQPPAGNVVCFGDSGFGQLGTGTSEVSMPIQADGASAFVELAAGMDFTCGIDAAGQVYCWGSNVFGALGVGAPTDSYDFPEQCTDSNNVTAACAREPTRVTALPPAAHIAASYLQVCAVTVAGDVYCWGTPSRTSPSSAGACFSNNPDCTPTPQLVSGVAHATSIAVGAGHACALTGPTEVTCWGLDTHGQLGRGAGPTLDLTPAPVLFPPEP